MTTAPEVLDPEAPKQSAGVGLEKKELASDVLASIGAAQVQARYAMALKRPRDWDEVRSKVLHACERPFFAQTALYEKPMGTSKVTGLSIRFAEEAQRCMGNIMPERLVIFDDTTKRIVRMAITDVENNVTHYKDIVLEKTVERKNAKGRKVLAQRPNSYGEIVYLVEATEDELLTKESAISSKIERQLTLKILPGDIQEEAIATVRATLRKADKADPEAAKNRLVDGFDDFGVKVADLKQYLNVDSLDNIQPRDMEQLRAIWTAIKEGETNWREVMEQRAQTRGDAGTGAKDENKKGIPADKARDAAKRAAANVGAKREPQPTQTAPPAQEEKPAQQEAQAQPAVEAQLEPQKEDEGW